MIRRNPLRSVSMFGLALCATVAGCEVVSGLSDLTFDGRGGGGAGGGCVSSGGLGGAGGNGQSTSQSSAGGQGGDGGQGGGPVVSALFNQRSRYTCALRGADYYCWGQSPDFPPATISPQILSVPPDTVEGLADETYCVRTSGGELRCWGENDLGQLGTGDTTPLSGPDAAALLPAPVTKATLSGAVACAIAGATSDAYCWGDNDDAMVAFPDDGAPHATPELVALPGPPAPVDQIGAGVYVACARRGTEVYCWGWNTNGDIGSDVPNGVYPPTLVQTDPAKELAVLGFGACIVSMSDEAFCWGNTLFSSPTPVSVPELDGASQLEGGDLHVCGIKPNGDVTCVGTNAHFELGGDTIFEDSATVEIPGGAASVVGGYWMSCALSLTGQVHCWGDNTGGALGLPHDNGAFSAPQPVNFP